MEKHRVFKSFYEGYMNNMDDELRKMMLKTEELHIKEFLTVYGFISLAEILRKLGYKAEIEDLRYGYIDPRDVKIEIRKIPASKKERFLCIDNLNELL